MARCKDEACNEVERLPEGAAIAESSLSEDDYLEKSRTFPLRVNENVVLVVLVVLVVAATAHSKRYSRMGTGRNA